MSQNPITELVIATSNRGKLDELRNLFNPHNVTLRSLNDFPQLQQIPQPQENGQTFPQNAAIKACYYGKILKQWVLADDSGLEVDHLKGQPGVYSSRFADYQGQDPKQRDLANNQKLIQLLQNIPQNQRTARFRCALCLVNTQKITLEVAGTLEGYITLNPQGENGFGYDPIFFLPQKNCTVAQLQNTKKNQISHRGNAFKNLIQKLIENHLITSL